MRRFLRGCLLPLFLFFILAVVLWAFSAPVLTAAANLLIENDGPRKVDAIVVLGGDGFGDRTLQGAKLAKEGYAPFVIVSGPKTLVSFESAEEVQFAQQHGYPAALFREVHLPGEAESTRTEADELGKYLKAQGIKSVLLVTSNYHTRRAKKLWRIENPWLQVSVVPSVDPERLFTPGTWWKTRPGQKTFLYEWMKTISVMLGV